MAKLKEMMGEKVISGFKGELDFYYHDGIPCVRRWPKSPGSRRAPSVQAGWTPFTAAVKAWQTLPASAKLAYGAMVAGTGLRNFDAHMRSYMAGLTRLYEHEGSPAPPANPSYWALTNIRRHTSYTGDLVCAFTDNPCHLWLRITSVPIKVHRQLVMRRGIMMHCDIDLCFVAYVENEQRELGDTLNHSFVVPWPKNRVFYNFYLHGEIASSTSPSTSPVFGCLLETLFNAPPIIENWEE